MDPLKKKFAEKSAALRTKIKATLKEKGATKVDEVTLKQVFGGMRGVKSMVWETSELDAIDGIRFRGYSIPELRKLLPTVEGGKETLPEGLFWLMLVGEIPTKEEVKWLTDQWTNRSIVPEHTFKMLDAMPVDTCSGVYLSPFLPWWKAYRTRYFIGLGSKLRSHVGYRRR